MRPEKLIENAMRKQGSIVMNLMTAPDCLATLDGTCFGSRLGKAVSYILTPWIIILSNIEEYIMAENNQPQNQ